MAADAERVKARLAAKHARAQTLSKTNAADRAPTPHPSQSKRDAADRVIHYIMLLFIFTLLRDGVAHKMCNPGRSHVQLQLSYGRPILCTAATQLARHGAGEGGGGGAGNEAESMCVAFGIGGPASASGSLAFFCGGSW